MNPNLSSSEAHVLFGKLYRKERPPELQKKVDDVVSATQDVFVRIKRIEEIDEGYSRENKGVEVRSSNQRRARGSGGNRPSGSANSKAPNRKKNVSKPKAGGESFFTRLFGSEIARWGEKTGTIESGFFGRNPSLASGIKSVFGYLSDDQIKITLAVFRGMLGSIWEAMEPAKYNTLIATYQFLIEFIKAEPAFLKQSDPADLAASTIRMQKAYAQLLVFPNYREILVNDFVKLVRDSEKFSGDAKVLQQVLNYISNLENKKPKLTHIIQALYILPKDRLLSWDDVQKTLAVKPPQLKQYRAPEAIMEVIHKKVRDLKDRISYNHHEAAEAERIKKEYLRIDASGKLDVSFLDPIIADVLPRLFSEQKNISKQVQQSYKSEPVKLLYCIMKDIELNLVFLLTSAVMTKEEGQHSEEVLIFKQNLFARHVNQFRENWRNLEVFAKKHRDLEYTFSNYLRDQKQPSTVAEHKEFLNLSRESMALIAKMALDLKTVVDNHELAVQNEALGKATEKLLSTKAISIDTLESGARFVPYSKREIFASTRMNGYQVLDLIRDYVKAMYNYLYIYRHPEFVSSLGSIAQKAKENEKIRSKLEFMGISVSESS